MNDVLYDSGHIEFISGTSERVVHLKISVSEQKEHDTIKRNMKRSNSDQNTRIFKNHVKPLRYVGYSPLKGLSILIPLSI